MRFFHHNIDKPHSVLMPVVGAVALTMFVSTFAISCGSSQSEPAYPEEPAGESAYEPMDPAAAPEETTDPAADPSNYDEVQQAPTEETTPPPGTMPPQGALESGAAPAAQVSKEEVEAFSICYLKLTQLQEKFEQRAQQGEGPDTLQQDFQRRALEILDSAGLSPKRYDEIARLVGQDPQLRQRIQRAIEAEVQG